MAWDYFRSGADGQRTLCENRRAFARRTLWPRMLVDVAARDLSTEILGARLSMPIAIAPTAYQKLAHETGEAATARAAAACNALMIVSTLATTSLEDVAQSCAGPRWFQLYVHRDRTLTQSLVERAAAAGYRALVVTVDTPILGRRIADERNGFRLPPHLTMANLPDAPMLQNVADGPMLQNVADASMLQNVAGGSSLNHYFAARHDASFSWRDLEWLRSLSPLPIVLKGILRADDAARAVSAGVDGIIVSNHGGRQLDGVPATIDALPGVVAAVANSKCVVLVDGGVRSGTDVLIALGLGARAVLVGRPILWGLAAGGEAGVRGVLEILRSELDRAMALAGCPTLASIGDDLVT